MTKSTPKASKPTPYLTPGAIVTGTDPCTCGHAPEEHGQDPRHPGSTACVECGGDCIAYEADPQEDES